MYRFLILTKKEGVATLTFNRPDQLNAMNREFMDEIISALEEINNDTAISVGVIQGIGKAFMAGADIKEYGSQTEEQFQAFQKKGISLYKLIEESPKPYIAAVSGYALGGGFEIMLACDLVIANAEALLGLPEVHLGLIPGGGGTQRLIRKIGLNRVNEMLFFGEQYSSEIMKEWGIVNYVVPLDTFNTKVQQLAQKLCRRSSKALHQLKRMSQLSVGDVPFTKRLETEAQTVSELFYGEEAKKKINDFINKNK